MGLSSEWINKAFNHYGPAEVDILDDVATNDTGFDNWQHLTRCQGIRFGPSYSYATQMHRWEGQDVETQQRITGSQARLSLVLPEDLNAAAMQLLHGDKTSVQTISDPSVSYEEFHRMLFVDQSTGDPQEAHVGPDVSAANYSRLPGPTLSAATPTGSDGSGWSTGGTPDYYFWAQGVYLRAGASPPTATTIMDSDKDDITWVRGAPSDDDAATAGYQGEPVDFSGATEHVVFTVTDPTGDVALPDYYILWINTTNDLATATMLAGGIAIRDPDGTTTITVLTSAGGGDTYAAAKGATFWYNAGTHDAPSWTQLVIDTDVTWDNDRGVMALKAGSTRNGFWVVARLFYVKPYTVQNNIGPTGISTDVRKVRIRCQEPEVEGANPLYPEGMTIILNKVDFAGLASEEGYSDDAFYGGTNLDLKCLVDPANGGYFGTKTIESNKYRSYTQQSV